MNDSENKSEIIVKGNGTELNNTKALQGRAKRKMITQKMALSLIDVARIKGEDERIPGYWNTFHCQSRVVSSEGKLYGDYCKQRICTVCSSIRKAQIMNQYLPILREWDEPYFVTLTVKAVPAKWLEGRVKDLLRAFKIITERYRKRHQRGKGKQLIGLKSLECNFNPQAKTYNPHLHLIVPNGEIAETLVNEWCKLWTSKFVSSAAQNSQPIRDREKCLMEVVKYGSKIFTEPDLKKKTKQNCSPFIYVSALDNILWAMKGHRIFDRCGFNAETSYKRKAGKSMPLKKYDQWDFDPAQSDWVNSESDEVLTGYMPPAELTVLLANNINLLIE